MPPDYTENEHKQVARMEGKATPHVRTWVSTSRARKVFMCKSECDFAL